MFWVVMVLAASHRFDVDDDVVVAADAAAFAVSVLMVFAPPFQSYVANVVAVIDGCSALEQP